MNLRKIAGLLLLALFIVFMTTSPGEAARVVKTVGQSLGDVFSALSHGFQRFMSSLF